MARTRKILVRTLMTLAGTVLLTLLLARVLYGGGREYPDMSTEPVLLSSDVDVAFEYGEPIGNVAASISEAAKTRLFFTVHPESRPRGHKLLEVADDAAVPYPSAEFQNHLVTPLGVYADEQDRLWVLDHANHGFGKTSIYAFDLASDSLVYRHVFQRSVARRLSFFNDLTITPDGRHIAIANVSFFGRKPSIVIHDTETGESRVFLEGHETVQHAGYVPVTPDKKMRFFGGLVDLMVGIDGIDFSRDGEYLYFAPMSHDRLFRLPTSVVLDPASTNADVISAVEDVAQKPLSDGIRTDKSGNVYITDIENSGVYVIPPNGEGYTLIKDERIRWADGFALPANGEVYLADSAIPDQMLRSRRHIENSAPYQILKFAEADISGTIRKKLRVGFLVTETVFNSELMAPYDIFHHTIFRDDSVYFEPFVVSPDGNGVTTFEGLFIEAHHSFESAPDIDVLVIPSTNNSMDSDLTDTRLMEWIKSTAESADWVITLCDGAFPLGQTGLLNGRTATTFPGDRERFAEMFPEVDVRFDKEFVVDGKFITSVGGALSYDPALYLVERVMSRTAAEKTAEGMVLDWKLDEIPYLVVDRP